MEATLAENLTVPFHLSITAPINETIITGYPALEGAYDPVEQVWKLPTGTPLTSLEANEIPDLFCATHTIVSGHVVVDDGQLDVQ
jgi:hypothetical protein